MTKDLHAAHVSIRRHMIAAVALALLVSLGAGTWASLTMISGAVIGEGQIIVESNSKKVQHPSGGVVGELRVRNGVHVEAGDIVLRLDETLTRANLAIVLGQIDELLARRARNEAERDEAAAIDFPADLLARNGDPAIARMLDGERTFFQLRKEARDGKKAQLHERIGQLETQHQGLAVQQVSKAKEIEWIEKELEGVRALWAKQMVQFSRVTALEREAVRMQGERGQLVATMAEIKGRVTQTNLEIIQVDQDMRSEVGRELGEIRGKLSELLERRVAAEDQLRRVDLRAPQSGTVHQLSVHTVGGVINPGEQVMLIVPDQDDLAVEVKIAPNDIDQVHVGQVAHLRFTAFNQQTTPELDGEVEVVGADAEHDPRTDVPYYMVRVGILPRETARLEGQKLVPGMPVECFIETAPRTVLSYLIRPIENQVRRAFRET